MIQTREDVLIVLQVAALFVALLTAATGLFLQEFRGYVAGRWLGRDIEPGYQPAVWLPTVALILTLGTIGSLILGLIFLKISDTVIALTTPFKRASDGHIPSPVRVKPPFSGTAIDTVASPLPVPKRIVVQGVPTIMIPGGGATIGCSGDVCEDDTHEAQNVYFARPFQLSQTETTNLQFASCVAEGSCSEPIVVATWAARPNLPVVGVDAENAQAFCMWMGGRLPFEDEWEYAARSGQSGIQFPWGQDLDDHLATYRGNSGGEPTAVGLREPNDFGLSDMSGNVAEWCLTRQPSDTPIVVRGGGFDSRWEELTVWTRVPSSWDRLGAQIGFRCVIEPGN